MFNKEHSDNLILNKESIKALSAETRIKILKILSKKQQTLSDLSQLLNLSAPTLKEHLNLLEKVELIKKQEEGRKWKYYHITENGLALLFPERKKIFITLSTLTISALGFIASIFLSSKNQFRSTLQTSTPEILMATKDATIQNEALTQAAPTIAQQTSILPTIALTIFSVIFLISLISLFYYYIKNKKTRIK